MRRKRHARCLAVAAGLLGTTAPGAASAHGDIDVERPARDEAPPQAAHARAEGEAGVAEEKGEEHEEHEERGTAALDVVLGWGRVPFAVQNLPTTGAQSLTYTRRDDVSSSVQSLVLSGSYELTPHFGVGVRLPVTFASFSPGDSPSRSTTALGNIELEAETGAQATRTVRVFAGLGVALPTAGGDEIPEGLANADAATVNESAYDRFSLSRAASLARGNEDNALFEPKRLGLVPRVGLTFRARSLSIEPSVKVENLVATTSSLSAGYVGEVVAGVRVGYSLGRHLEVAARAWAAVGFAGAADDKHTAVAVEPQIALHLGPLRPYAGVIIPVAGPPSDAGFVGVRLGLVAAF